MKNSKKRKKEKTKKEEKEPRRKKIRRRSQGKRYLACSGAGTTVGPRPTAASLSEPTEKKRKKSKEVPARVRRAGGRRRGVSANRREQRKNTADNGKNKNPRLQTRVSRVETPANGTPRLSATDQRPGQRTKVAGQMQEPRNISQMLGPRASIHAAECATRSTTQRSSRKRKPNLRQARVLQATVAPSLLARKIRQSKSKILRCGTVRWTPAALQRVQKENHCLAHQKPRTTPVLRRIQ
jgi:hypothetical protein